MGTPAGEGEALHGGTQCPHWSGCSSANASCRSQSSSDGRQGTSRPSSRASLGCPPAHCACRPVAIQFWSLSYRHVFFCDPFCLSGNLFESFWTEPNASLVVLLHHHHTLFEEMLQDLTTGPQNESESNPNFLLEHLIIAKVFHWQYFIVGWLYGDWKAVV